MKAFAVVLVLLLWPPLWSPVMAQVNTEYRDDLTLPRYVRLGENGSLLISDQDGITYVDPDGQAQEKILGSFCDVEWVNATTWVALNGSGWEANCNKLYYSDGRIYDLDHQGDRIHRIPAGFQISGYAGTTIIWEVDLEGNTLRSCDVGVGIRDQAPGYYLDSSKNLNTINLTTCQTSVIQTVPGSIAQSFYKLDNGTTALGINWANGSKTVRLDGWWEVEVPGAPTDLDWNGSALAVAVYHDNSISIWQFEPENVTPADGDGDGIPDAEDGCPGTWGNATDLPGCPDLDGDGVADSNDPCPDDPADLCLDPDGDGLNNSVDLCPDQWGNATDRAGCPDTDGDGTSDTADPCPQDPLDGCLDGDGDGWNDSTDDCPSEWGNSTEDRRGCPDGDGDGTSDLNDPCPDDPEDLCDGPIIWLPTVNEVYREIGYRWANIVLVTNESCNGTILSYGTTYYLEENRTRHNITFHGNEIEPNKTYTKTIRLTNQVNGTVQFDFIFTTPTEPTPEDKEVVIRSIEFQVTNTSVSIQFEANTTWCMYSYHETGSWYWAGEINLGFGWFYYNLLFDEREPDTDYYHSIYCAADELGPAKAWWNQTIRTSGGDGDGDGEGDGGDGEEENETGDQTGPMSPTYVPLLGLLIIGVVALSLIQRRPRPKTPGSDVDWEAFIPYHTELDPFEDEEPAASPDLFSEIQMSYPPPIAGPPIAGPSLPNLAIPLVHAEDIPQVFEGLVNRLVPKICDENRRVLRDVDELEKRIRQLRDSGDIAPRQYEKQIRELKELRGAIQNLTPLMKKEDWDR